MYETKQVLRSDPTGSGRTEERTKRQIRRTAIDCPHQNACWEERSQEQRRNKMARAEPEDPSVPKNLREIRGRRK